MRVKCSYLVLFWSAFSRIRTYYGEMRSIYPHSVRMQENADQNKSEYGHFLRSDTDDIKCRFKVNRFPSFKINKTWKFSC